MITPQTYRSSDGTRLVGIEAIPETARGVVTLCHGLGEHCRRYDHVTEALFNAGIAVFALDLRGHGQSGGKRGHVDRWQNYVDDMATLHNAANTPELAKLPRIQLGHSMGGLVAVHVALTRQAELAGLALSGPLLGVAQKVPKAKAAIGNVLSNIWPALSLSNDIPASAISRDPETVARYEADTLVHDRVSTRWFTEMNAAIETAHARAGELTLPIWLAHGTADKLTDPHGSRAFLANVNGPVSQHFMVDCRHEIFNEIQPDRDQAIGSLVEWATSII